MVAGQLGEVIPGLYVHVSGKVVGFSPEFLSGAGIDWRPEKESDSEQRDTVAIIFWGVDNLRQRRFIRVFDERKKAVKAFGTGEDIYWEIFPALPTYAEYKTLDGKNGAKTPFIVLSDPPADGGTRQELVLVRGERAPNLAVAGEGRWIALHQPTGVALCTRRQPK